MKYNLIVDQQGSLVEHMVLCLISDYARKAGHGTDIRSVEEWKDMTLRDVDICLTIDGVEVDVEVFLNRMASVRDEYVAEQAMVLFQEKLSNVVDKGQEIEDTLTRINEKLTQEAEKTLGMEFHDD